MHSLEGMTSVKGGNSFKYQNWDRKYGMLKESVKYNDEYLSDHRAPISSFW